MVSVHVNPLDCNLIISAGNDHTARICDLRMLSGSEQPTAAAPGGASWLRAYARWTSRALASVQGLCQVWLQGPRS